MGTMKGILKGLRYISSQIFDDDEKEPEMQIGLPTDVKHVAHIGLDESSANAKTPTWMNDIGSDPNAEAKKHASEDGNRIQESQASNEKHSKHKSRRKSSSTGTGSPLASPTRKDSPDLPKQPRRHRSPNVSLGSPGRESPSRLPRRPHNSNTGVDSPSRDQPAIPKHSRHKKSKSKGGEPTKLSRSKEEIHGTDM